jgi:alkylation response protein AidB-like acyl-CoA dehydrogenase
MTDLFQLTDDQLAIQDMARKFTADRITPFAAQWDEECHYPVDVWKAAGELGFGAIYVSEESGGTGLGRLEAALIMKPWPMAVRRQAPTSRSTTWSPG